MRAFLILSVTALLAGCMEPEMPGPQDGRALFMENCAICHGENGRGDGEMARAMARAPADLTLIALRNGSTFPRARVMSSVDGYTRSDIDLPGMPEFGELLKGDLVPFDSGDGKPTPTPRHLVALVEYLESIQQTR
jgi:hypothetical protein